MAEPIQFDDEPVSNRYRERILAEEPIAQRTFTPTQAVLARSAGLFHFTPEGRRLADFTSGVLVANLGHNPRDWFARFAGYMEWTAGVLEGGQGYVALPPLTTYNAISTLESEANRRLLASLRRTPFGRRMERVLWSASGSEGIQKALWAALHRRPGREMILATRHGFHGKKGLAGAVTGTEESPERDPRVRFIRFPREECRDLAAGATACDLKTYRNELDRLAEELGERLCCLVTEPYLGGGGSYHPPAEYLKLLVDFCRERDLVFILDEVQSNFGRTGEMYAFEKYRIEPDLVVLGKGMGNGVPVNAVVGRADVLASLDYGEASDTWSAHPIGCAATLATLDVFESTAVLENARAASERVRAGLLRLRELPIIAAVRGEGMVWGVECAAAGGRSSQEVAVECVRACYLGDANGDAIHLLGPLAGNVLRVAPPLTMTAAEADHWTGVLFRILQELAARLRSVGKAT